MEYDFGRTKGGMSNGKITEAQIIGALEKERRVAVPHALLGVWTPSIARKVRTQGAAKSWVTKPWRATQKSILKSLHTDPLPVRGKFVERELDITRKLHHGDLLQHAGRLRAGAEREDCGPGSIAGEPAG